MQYWSSDKRKKTFGNPVAVLLSSKNQRDMQSEIELLGPLHTEVEHRTQSTGLPGIHTLTVGIMQELGFWLQMTKWGNLIKYRICKSICAEDYKGSASLNPQSDISPNGGYINQRTRRTSLRRPPLYFL